MILDLFRSDDFPTEACRSPDHHLECKRRLLFVHSLGKAKEITTAIITESYLASSFVFVSCCLDSIILTRESWMMSGTWSYKARKRQPPQLSRRGNPVPSSGPWPHPPSAVSPSPHRLDSRARAAWMMAWRTIGRIKLGWGENSKQTDGIEAVILVFPLPPRPSWPMLSWDPSEVRPHLCLWSWRLKLKNKKIADNWLIVPSSLHGRNLASC